MSKYVAYPEYRDSETEWLGEVPAHWHVFSGKRIFNTIRKKALKTDEQLAASQKHGVIPQSKMMELNDSKVMLALKGTDSFRHVDKNNFVISLRSFEGGIEHSNYVGCVSPAYTVLEGSKPIAFGYYKYLLKSAPYIAALQASTDSLRDGKSISYEQFGAIDLPIAESGEQTQIANFLDYETAKIDTLIDKQQQLIKLLKEKRQAVISHAVTKGLPSVNGEAQAPMKDSGVEWLGEVPEHWKVAALKYLVSAPIIDGPHVSPTRCDTGIPFISAEAVRNGRINFDKKWGYISEAAHAQYSKRYSPQINDLLIVKLGATTGAIAIVETDEPFNIWVPLATVRTVAELDSKFVYYLFQSSQIADAIQQSWTFGTQQTLGLGTLSNLQIPVPPADECKSIVIEIESKVVQFDQVINKSTVSLELLKERRTALISAAVTGKIDVRNWQAPTSQEQSLEQTA